MNTTTKATTDIAAKITARALRAAFHATIAASSLLLVLHAPARANQHEHSHDAHADTHAEASPADAVDEFVSAEIKAIDRDNGKLMLKHEAIHKFNMNAMTMGFRVADPKLLESLLVGDKVRFLPDRVNGQFVITRIEKLQ